MLVQCGETRFEVFVRLFVLKCRRNEILNAYLANLSLHLHRSSEYQQFTRYVHTVEVFAWIRFRIAAALGFVQNLRKVSITRTKGVEQETHRAAKDAFDSCYSIVAVVQLQKSIDQR